jgi:hypothetical protein
MSSFNRGSRIVLFGAVLALPAALFGLGIRLGAMPFVLAAAAFCIALLLWRIFALNGIGWARTGFERLAAVLDRTHERIALNVSTAQPEAETRSVVNADAFERPVWADLPRRIVFDLPGAPAWRGWLGLAAIALAVLVPLAMRVYRLADLQAEQYGDINIVFEYVRDIRNGLWPFRFVLSSGPLYHYLIVPLISLAGQNYFGIKIASVVTSLAVLALGYLVGRRFFGHTFGLLVLFITGISSWLLVFSRLGNSQILVPVLVSGALYCLIRYEQGGRLWWVGLAAGVSGLGFYGYPQSFAVAPAMLIALVILLVARRRPLLKPLGLFLLITLVVSVPFDIYFVQAPERFVEGYIGGKLTDTPAPLSAFIGNLGRAFGAYHLQGDAVFRSNTPNQPHLDAISGLLMLVGVGFWLRPGRRRWALVWVVLLFMLQMPSMLVLAFPDEVPSASRALGAAPIAYVLVASGAWALLALARWAKLPRAVVGLSTVAVLAVLLGLNARRYFVDYIGGLPYFNTPVGRIMTDYVDLLPPETNVYMCGCCWTSGMPEPKTLRYEMRGNRQLIDLPAGSLTCETLAAALQPPAVVLWSSAEAFASPALAACPAALPGQLFVSPENHPVFHAAVYRPEVALNTGPLVSPLTPPSGDASGGMATPEDMGAALRSIDGMSSVDVDISGRPAVLSHSQLDIGQSFSMVDGDGDTLARSREANPFMLNLAFPEPKMLKRILIKTQTLIDARVIIKVIGADGTVSEIRQAFTNSEPNPTLSFDLGFDPVNVAVLRIELVDRRPVPGDGYHWHIYEIAVE